MVLGLPAFRHYCLSQGRLIVRTQLKDLSLKVHTTVHPYFLPGRLNTISNCEKLSRRLWTNSALFTNLNALCDAGYVGFTRRHLHQRVEEPKNYSSSIGKHFRDKHSTAQKDPPNIFRVFMKFTNKFDCPVCAMFFTHELRPTLNVQSDSIRAKVFNYPFISFFLCIFLSVARLHLKLFSNFLHAFIYIHCSSFTIHLIMTEVRSKRRLLPLIFIVKSFTKPLLIIGN